ncbi:tRNA (adenine22-N1)-methyltransferase [Desulfitispora alkaliphila]|uniref:tRNA (adenine(22)-N(1))-methyltransferase n=1 Tax=Desulfitispora alkaliphila TaxID=622674 RepID=UPI003D23F745
MIELSDRLEKIIELIPEGKVVVDVGTDHGYIPIKLLQRGLAPTAIATDINKGPFQIARKQVQEYLLNDKIDVRLGNGLKPIQAGEAQVAIIAGMGGVTIVDILEDAPHVVRELETLVLQPMTAVDAVRRWLYKSKWDLSNEDIVKEGNKYYHIIVATKANTYEWPEVLNKEYFEFGPKLIEQGNPLVIEQIELKIQQFLEVQQRLGKLELSESVKNRLKEVEEEISNLKEMKNRCLQNASK